MALLVIVLFTVVPLVLLLADLLRSGAKPREVPFAGPSHAAALVHEHDIAATSIHEVAPERRVPITPGHRTAFLGAGVRPAPVSSAFAPAGRKDVFGDGLLDRTA